QLRGDERFDLLGIERLSAPRQQVTLVIHRTGGKEERVPLLVRIDTPIEVDYYRHGGILPFVLRQLVA
ncbi:MAG TPA: hypothetical protein VKE50_00835, partial [Thermoanaerobaculia bacterium]|nr:hypothetical protein [Thermoanaerobaculia bacterium]